ncbi:MAG: hypothetical protein ABIX01_09005 [Chitinophagaceae bacterium]
MKKLCFIVLMPLAILAQPRKDGRQLVALPINSEPDHLEGSKYYLIVDKPVCVQIKPNQTFIVQSAWHKEGDSIVTIGAGTLSRINKKEAELTASITKGKEVLQGDVAMFLVPLKPPGKDSVFFKMARLAIGLTTVNDSLFYDRNAMLQNPAAYPTQDLAQAMAGDIRYTGAEMVKQENSQDQEIKTGKYKGQRLFAMMQVAKASDLLQFVQYVYAKPQKYMAHNWKVSETFATWVINGAP